MAIRVTQVHRSETSEHLRLYFSNEVSKCCRRICGVTITINTGRLGGRLQAATSGELWTGYWAHMRVLPPSTGNWTPVVKLASSLARNAIAFATSSGRP